MSKAIHIRDSTRVGIGLGVDSPQKTFNWVAYMLKAKVRDFNETTRERIRTKMVEVNIPNIGNSQNIFLCTIKRNKLCVALMRWGEDDTSGATVHFMHESYVIY